MTLTQLLGERLEFPRLAESRGHPKGSRQGRRHGGLKPHELFGELVVISCNWNTGVGRVEDSCAGRRRGWRSSNETVRGLAAILEFVLLGS